jgi:hypothetical protein
MLDMVRENRRMRLLTALAIGLAFGFLLDKGGATEYEVIVNQLLMRDFTVLKIILSAILTGMIGVYVLVSRGIADLSPKPCITWAIVTGGLVFGAGFAILGYCPGTMAGAVGTGSIHAAAGMLGILVGAGAYASVYPWVRKRLHVMDHGSITIPDALGVNPWVVVCGVAVAIIGCLYLIETMP